MKGSDATGALCSTNNVLHMKSLAMDRDMNNGVVCRHSPSGR
eukprot:CCRYP_015663-RA/>CCRYP_015663-RA protein AED:0.00 eAED:0.00 QI:45/1/1/1/0/0/2/80/41